MTIAPIVTMDAMIIAIRDQLIPRSDEVEVDGAGVDCDIRAGVVADAEGVEVGGAW